MGEAMLIIELLIITAIEVYKYHSIILSEKIKEVLRLAFIIIIVKCFLDGRIALLILNIVICFFRNSVWENFQERKYKVVLKYFILVMLLLFINRGVGNRVYDEAGVLSPLQEYELNSNLSRQHSLITKGTKFYIITKSPDTDMKQFNKKIRNKYFYTLILCYDNNGKYYRSKVIKRTQYGADDIEIDITEKMTKDGLRACLDSAPEMMNWALYGFESPFEGDDDYYADSPGTHWVNGYDRSDGTHVNGYERSNPDGNPYNNLNP